jgi:hypothetical protein
LIVAVGEPLNPRIWTSNVLGRGDCLSFHSRVLVAYYPVLRYSLTFVSRVIVLARIGEAIDNNPTE